MIGLDPREPNNVYVDVTRTGNNSLEGIMSDTRSYFEFHPFEEIYLAFVYQVDHAQASVGERAGSEKDSIYVDDTPFPSMPQLASFSGDSRKGNATYANLAPASEWIKKLKRFFIIDDKGKPK